MGKKKELLEKRNIDARIKLLLIIEQGLLSFFTGSNGLILIAFLLSAFTLLWFKQYSATSRFSAVFAVVFIISCLAPLLGATPFGMILGMLTYLILRMIPELMLGSWLVNTTNISDFIASMEKMKLPFVIIIPLAVTLRFMPTIRAEFRNIKNTMKMRGIGLSFSSVIRHPLMTTEYVMVPLLMRSIKIADELSASALTRGLGSHKSRTSYHNIRLNTRDIAWAAGFTFLVVAVFIQSAQGVLPI